MSHESRIHAVGAMRFAPFNEYLGPWGLLVRKYPTLDGKVALERKHMTRSTLICADMTGRAS